MGCFSGTLKEFLSRLTDDPAHEFYRRVVPVMHAELERRMIPVDWHGND